ncbi:MAG: CHAD domain-containing protein [Terriglobales bacterium]
MPIDAKRSRLAFRNLARELTKLERKPAPENVHKFRTNSRRVEALLLEVVREPRRNDEKLLKRLARLRKKAGRVRDLDVQISCLRNLKIPQGNGHKTQFLETLVQERALREKKLARAFDHKTAAEIRKRLKRAASEMSIPKNTEPLSLTVNRLAQLGRGQEPITEKILHQYRIIGKRARYIAELAVDDPETVRLVADLKKMQDVIGDWHDWLKLTQKAEELLGNSRDSALVAMLRNVTQAKFRQSLDAVAEIRTAFANNGSGARRRSVTTGKPSTREADGPSAAVA